MSISVPLYGFGASGGSGGTLTVTTPGAGITVTAAKDGKTKTKLSVADGTAVFKGLEGGTWTITMTDGSQTAQKMVAVTTDYAVALTFLAATINITYPAGSTCTATDGVTTLTAPDTSGTWSCVVPNAGTWTVSLSNGFKEQVLISANGEEKTVDKWYLYNAGDERNYITGGFARNSNIVVGSADGGGNTGTITKNTDSLYFRAPSMGSSVITTGKKINLGNYKTLHIDGSGTGFYGVHEFTSGVLAEQAPVQGWLTSGSGDVDISALDGYYYISFGAYNNSRTFTCTKVMLY